MTLAQLGESPRPSTWLPIEYMSRKYFHTVFSFVAKLGDFTINSPVVSGPNTGVEKNDDCSAQKASMFASESHAGRLLSVLAASV